MGTIDLLLSRPASPSPSTSHRIGFIPAASPRSLQKTGKHEARLVPALESNHRPQAAIQPRDHLTFWGETLALDPSLWFCCEDLQTSPSSLVFLAVPGAGGRMTDAIRELWLVLEMIIC